MTGPGGWEVSTVKLLHQEPPLPYENPGDPPPGPAPFTTRNFWIVPNTKHEFRYSFSVANGSGPLTTGDLYFEYRIPGGDWTILSYGKNVIPGYYALDGDGLPYEVPGDLLTASPVISGRVGWRIEFRTRLEWVDGPWYSGTRIGVIVPEKIAMLPDTITIAGLPPVLLDAEVPAVLETVGLNDIQTVAELLARSGELHAIVEDVAMPPIVSLPVAQIAGLPATTTDVQTPAVVGTVGLSDIQVVADLLARSGELEPIAEE